MKFNSYTWELNLYESHTQFNTKLTLFNKRIYKFNYLFIPYA